MLLAQLVDSAVVGGTSAVAVWLLLRDRLVRIEKDIDGIWTALAHIEDLLNGGDHGEET